MRRMRIYPDMNIIMRIMQKKSVRENAIFALFLIISLFLLSISFAAGQVSIDSMDVPATIDENTTLTVSFSASTDTSNNISYKIYLEGLLVSNTSTYERFMNYSSSGSYNFVLFASDIVTNATEEQTVDVNDVPMSLTLDSPINRNYNNRTINATAEISTYADSCNYSLSGSGILSGGQLNYAGIYDGKIRYSSDVPLNDDGSYNLIVTCSNAFESNNASVAFSVNALAPSILAKSYTIDSSNTVTISASTDSVCACKYDVSDIPFDSMGPFFSSTNALQHSTSLGALADGSYNYYIKCRNSIGNVAGALVSFNVLSLPTASISLSKSSPIKAGTYEVRLTTSESVPNAPALYYQFDGDSTTRYITLTGSGSNWKGYMIIEDNTPNKIGTFHYSAADYNNNVGNKITGGEVFLVDSIKPVAPSSVDAIEQYDGSIKLKWYYDGEEVHRFNIYRSTRGAPDYVDYYDSVSGTQYVDRDVIDGVIYYYTIAAVDDAENDGVLSSVVEATSTMSSYVPASNDAGDAGKSSPGPAPKASLSPALVPKVEQLVSELDSYIYDVDSKKSDINSINDPAKLKVISAMKLAENANTAKSTIEGIISSVNGLKDEDMKSAELDVQLNKFRMDAIKAKSLVAEDIIVNEQSSFDQVTQASDVDTAISGVVNVNLSRKILDNYSLENKKMQDNIIVKTEVLIFKIKYLGKDDYDKYTLVKKVVSSSSELKEVSIIETIPKSFENMASDMVFDIEGQQAPAIVKDNPDNPVLRWDLSALNTQTIYYLSNSNAEMSSAKETKTVVLYTPNFKVSDTVSLGDTSNGNALTGFVGLNLPDVKTFSLIQWMVILGVGMILGLSTYYVVLDKKEKRRNVQRLREHKIISGQVLRPVQRNVAPANTARQVPTASPISPAKVSSFFDLNSMMEKSNDMINAMDYESSRMIYNECMKRFKTTRFRNESSKDEADMMLNHIYIKLVAYRTIYASRKHLAAKNIASAKSDLSMITKICDKLELSLKHVDEDHKIQEEKYLRYIDSSKKYVEKILGV